MKIIVFALAFILYVYTSNRTNAKNIQLKPRLIITTDIGGDPDDTQSLIRLLVTSNEFQIEGIIASASGTLGELDTQVVRPDLVLEAINAYGKVFHHLSEHAKFPTPEYLSSIVKSGNPYRGLQYIGNGMDTEGSEWIKQQIIKRDNLPLNIAIWGGQTDVVQALWSLKNSISWSRFQETISNVKFYDINDQDNLFSYIQEEFPELFYVHAGAPEGKDKRQGGYRGMYLGGDESLTSKEWIAENIQSNHGALGELYPMNTWTAPNPYGCLKEGDTPSWFYFMENGLNDASHPSFGGWGGRFKRDTLNYFIDDKDLVDKVYSAGATVWRWRNAFQNDFAARMDWTKSDDNHTNHHPVAVICRDTSHHIMNMKAEINDTILIDASESFDPDGNALTFNWWVYPEPSGITYQSNISPKQGEIVNFVFDEAFQNKRIHLILEISDDGQPSLTSYRRIIINVN